MTSLEIKPITNKHGSKVYHIEETIDGHGIVQEFGTLKEAQEYLHYIKELEG
jgi:cell fate (sporulation/competence/biofilm development) regulator YmcA (YheA/YmcA/DUF963 family)